MRTIRVSGAAACAALGNAIAEHTPAMAYSGRKEMDESSSPICAICLGALRDARLLDCLHSFCKSCLDDLDMRTGHGKEVTCPVCRSISHFPENGAAGLPMDITVSVNPPSECHTCSTGDGEGKPEVSCTTCHLSFCTQHALPHVLANSGHHIGALHTDTASSPSQPATSPRLCQVHGLPARLICQQCSTTVCAECAVVGAHHGHKPIVALKNIAKDLQERVGRKLSELKNTRLPEAQMSLSSVEDVSADLSARAKNIRAAIRTSAKRVHNIVELVMQQKLAQVDDLEELRLKHLDSQQDGLKRHIDNLKSVICFGEKFLRTNEQAVTEEGYEILLAIEKQADKVDNARGREKPVEHAHMNFETIKEESLAAKANELVGTLIPFEESAMYSIEEVKTKEECSEAVTESVASQGQLSQHGVQLERCNFASLSSSASSMMFGQAISSYPISSNHDVSATTIQGTTQASSRQQQPSLAEMFKPKAGSWSCSGCYMSNSADVMKCPACGSPKPGSEDVSTTVASALASQRQTSQGGFQLKGLNVASQSNSSSSSGLATTSKSSLVYGPMPAANTQVTTLASSWQQQPSLAEMFKRKAGSWSCSGCYTLNSADVMKCPSCGSPKPGSKEMEDELFCEKAKLFHFYEGQWKEHGTGNLKLLKNRQSGRVRILMRGDQVLKVYANHLIVAGMNLKPLPSSDRALVWHTLANWVDAMPHEEKLAARFTKKEVAKRFKQIFEDNIPPVKV